MSETEQKKKQRERKHPAVVDETADDFFETLNGFDEIAIKKAFGKPPIELSDDDKMAFGRSLIFVAERRAGKTDTEALKAARTYTFGEVTDYFADDVEPMPEEPVTEQGKGAGEPETQTSSSPPSAS
jgi:hypothetical protein